MNNIPDIAKKELEKLLEGNKNANEQYPDLPEHFQSILKSVYPVIDGKGKFDCNNEFARKHTLWVEEYLLNNSSIINEAVNNNKLYIAKCHFDHNSGKVELIG